MKNRILKSIVISFVGLFLFSTCEDVDDTPPTVTITSPQDGSTVYEIVTISCISIDNEGVDKVELWIDGVSTGITDNTEPYSLDWNTTTYENKSYTITVRSYDVNDNMADSDPITLIVDNSISYPTKIEIYPIVYQDESLIVTWSQSPDIDFSSYYLYESLSEDLSDMTEIYSTTNLFDTIYVVTGVGYDELRYYQLVVTDVWGFETSSSVAVGSSFELIAATTYSGGYLYTVDINGKNIQQFSLVSNDSIQIVIIGTPSFYPNGSTIAFQGHIGGSYEIWSVGVNGLGLKRLTNDDNDSYNPQYSPDGSKIAYVSYSGDFSNIYIMNSDGSNKTNLTNSYSTNINSQFSPDGLKIVFVSGRDGNWEIYTMDSDGSNLLKLTDLSESMDKDEKPCFSPDGTKILFQRYSGCGYHIMLMNSDGSNLVTLTDCDFTYPKYSLNGYEILYIEEHVHLMLMNINNGSVSRLTYLHPGKDYHPSFNSNGSRIVYIRAVNGEGRDINVINPDGSNNVKVTNNPTGNSSSWFMYPQFQPRP